MTQYGADGGAAQPLLRGGLGSPHLPRTAVGVPVLFAAPPSTLRASPPISHQQRSDFTSSETSPMSIFKSSSGAPSWQSGWTGTEAFLVGVAGAACAALSSASSKRSGKMSKRSAPQRKVCAVRPRSIASEASVESGGVLVDEATVGSFEGWMRGRSGFGFVDIASRMPTFFQESMRQSVQGEPEDGWVYRKGIEGADVGIVWSELLMVPEQLASQWESLNSSLQKATTFVKEAGNVTALQANIGQSLGVSVDGLNGVPAQDKWTRLAGEWTHGGAHTQCRLPTGSLPVEMHPDEANGGLTVAGSVEAENLKVPTTAELRELFARQIARSSSSPPVSSNAEIDDAYVRCREITREHSKTFFLGSQLLDSDEQRAIWAIYHWCRATDELVDGPAGAGTTMADLEVWQEKLRRTFALDGKPVPGLQAWEEHSMRDTIQRYSLIQRPFQDMISGMAMDLVQTRYETFQCLEVYCYRVAGTVGLMTLPVLGFDSRHNLSEQQQERTIAAAMSLGMAFQLTNILRDVGEDARRGRIYLPLEDLRRFGISEDEVLVAARAPGRLHKDARWRNFMDFQFERCEKYYREAEEGLIGIAGPNRFGVLTAIKFYAAILSAVRENGYDNFTRRAFVPVVDKMQLLVKAWVSTLEMQMQIHLGIDAFATAEVKPEPAQWQTDVTNSDSSSYMNDLVNLDATDSNEKDESNLFDINLAGAPHAPTYEQRKKCLIE